MLRRGVVTGALLLKPRAASPAKHLRTRRICTTSPRQLQPARSLAERWLHSERQQQGISSLSSQQIRAEAAADAAWARQPGIVKALQPPPFDAAAPPDLSSTEAYLASRFWTNILPSDAAAMRIISHLLTYPLTLAAALASVENTRSFSRAGLHVECIGARAEATLPPHLWAEALFSCGRLLDGGRLTFIGPELGVPRAVKPASSGDTAPCHTLRQGGRSLELQWVRGLFHDTASGRALRHDSCNRTEGSIHTVDAYVLFSPGLGHLHLSTGWQATADLVMASQTPVILTAHSEGDARRDVAWLEGRYGADIRWLSPPAANAFASRRRTLDAADGGLAVAANAYWYAVQGTATGAQHK